MRKWASNKKRALQLGMGIAKASWRLRKLVLFHVLRKHGENVCYRCGKFIEHADDLTIEHKQPWLDVSVELFWDMANIAFSHFDCNRPDRSTKKNGMPGHSWCNGCKQWLPLQSFNRSSRRWNGVKYECRACERAYDDTRPRRQAPKYRKAARFKSSVQEQGP
jgi:hypothetical protein